MSPENQEIVQRAYAALNERDFDSLVKLNDPDGVFDFSRSIGRRAARPHRRPASPSREREGSGLDWENEPDATFVFEVRDGKIFSTTLYQHHTEALKAVGLEE